MMYIKSPVDWTIIVTSYHQLTRQFSSISHLDNVVTLYHQQTGQFSYMKSPTESRSNFNQTLKLSTCWVWWPKQADELPVFSKCCTPQYWALSLHKTYWPLAMIKVLSEQFNWWLSSICLLGWHINIIHKHNTSGVLWWSIQTLSVSVQFWGNKFL